MMDSLTYHLLFYAHIRSEVKKEVRRKSREGAAALRRLSMTKNSNDTSSAEAHELEQLRTQMKKKRTTSNKFRESMQRRLSQEQSTRDANELAKLREESAAAKELAKLREERKKEQQQQQQKQNNIPSAKEIETIHRNADKTFSKIDVDGSGSLSRAEFKVHLSASGYDVETIDKIFNSMDVNNDGDISREEFRHGMVMLAALKKDPSGRKKKAESVISSDDSKPPELANHRSASQEKIIQTRSRRGGLERQMSQSLGHAARSRSVEDLAPTLIHRSASQEEIVPDSVAPRPHRGQLARQMSLSLVPGSQQADPPTPAELAKLRGRTSQKQQTDGPSACEIETIHRNADATFAKIDVDGSGGLSREEFTNHLSSSGYDAETIDKIFKSMDVDGDGDISRKEFRRGMVMMAAIKKPEGSKKESNRRTSQKQQTDGPSAKEIEAIHRNADATFAKIDVDGSGGLSREEFTNHLSSSGYDAETIDKIFKSMDVDGDGDISRKEFRRGMVMMAAIKKPEGSKKEPNRRTSQESKKSQDSSTRRDSTNRRKMTRRVSSSMSNVMMNHEVEAAAQRRKSKSDTYQADDDLRLDMSKEDVDLLDLDLGLKPLKPPTTGNRRPNRRDELERRNSLDSSILRKWGTTTTTAADGLTSRRSAAERRRISIDASMKLAKGDMKVTTMKLGEPLNKGRRARSRSLERKDKSGMNRRRSYSHDSSRNSRDVFDELLKDDAIDDDLLDKRNQDRRKSEAATKEKRKSEAATKENLSGTEHRRRSHDEDTTKETEQNSQRRGSTVKTAAVTTDGSPSKKEDISSSEQKRRHTTGPRRTRQRRTTMMQSIKDISGAVKAKRTRQRHTEPPRRRRPEAYTTAAAAGTTAVVATTLATVSEDKTPDEESPDDKKSPGEQSPIPEEEGVDQSISQEKKDPPRRGGCCGMSYLACSTMCLCYILSIVLFGGLGFWLHMEFFADGTSLFSMSGKDSEETLNTLGNTAAGTLQENSTATPSLSPSSNGTELGTFIDSDGNVITKQAPSTAVPSLSNLPSYLPSAEPSSVPSTSYPSSMPSEALTESPSNFPSNFPTVAPSTSELPTMAPSYMPSTSPTTVPGCPNELTKSISLGDDNLLTLNYEIVEYQGQLGVQNGGGLLCAQLDYIGAAGWIGLALSEASRNPQFGRKEAIIGIPGMVSFDAVGDDGSVSLGQQLGGGIEGGPPFANPAKYDIRAGGIGDDAYNGPALSGLREIDKQTLVNGSTIFVIDQGGEVHTQMYFTKFLREPGEIDIDPYGYTLLLFAVASWDATSGEYDANPEWQDTTVNFLSSFGKSVLGSVTRKRKRKHSIG